MRITDLLSENTRTDEFAPVVGAALRGAATLGANAVKTGAQAVGNVAAAGTNAIGTGIKQISNIKNTVSDLRNVMQQAGGSNIDVNKLTQALATQAPGQQIDPVTMKSLQGMIPALADTLKNPQTAAALKQALTTGVKADVQQDAQDAQQQQNKPGAVGSTGSTSNTIAPTA